MPGKTGDATAATREQLLALVQRRGQAKRAVPTFVTAMKRSVQSRRPGEEAAACLELLEAALGTRQPQWAQTLADGEASGPKRAADSVRKDVVCAAKVAQSLVKAYASAGAAAAKAEEQADIVAAMDLACMALYVVCAQERAVQLGDLVVDNLLYQVAKKYGELPGARESSIGVAACVHIRLWKAHAALSKEPYNGLTGGSKLMASLVLKEEHSSDRMNMVVKRPDILAELPTPSSCHTAQFARLLLGHTNTCISLLAAAKHHKAVLFVSKAMLSPWIEHLQSLPGENTKIASSSSDRAFRILWKCASAVDSGGQKKPGILSAVLCFREAALSFLIKCSNYTSSYYIQQVNRVGVQHERASKRSRLGFQELHSFYVRSANSLAQANPSSTHLYSSKTLQWEYVQWLDHFASVCEGAGLDLESTMVLENAIHYVELFDDQGKSIQSCLLFFIAGTFLGTAESTEGNKLLKPQDGPAHSEFCGRLNAGISKIIRDLIQRSLSDGGSDCFEKAARVCLKKLEALSPCHFVTIARKHPGFISFLTRCLKRSSTKIFNYAVSAQHSAKYQLYSQVISSFGEFCRAVKELRSALPATESNKIIEGLMLDESRLHRMAVVLLVRCCMDNNGSNTTQHLNAVYRQVNFVRELLDEATKDGKPSDLILQGVLGDLKSIARECYGFATCCYKKNRYQDTISALMGAFELAESYLEYVMCSSLTAEDIHDAHAQLKADAIVSLLAYCFHELGDIPKARKFTGYSLLYSGNINEKIPHTTVDKFVSLIIEELKVESDDVILTDFKGFVTNASHVFKARHITKHQIIEMWRAFRVAFERSSARIMTTMRTHDCDDTDHATDAPSEVAVNLCCVLQDFMDDIVIKSIDGSEKGEPYYAALADISGALTKRTWSYYAYYAKNGHEGAVQGLQEAYQSLSNAAEKLSVFTGTGSDLGGVYGWRGIITMEIAVLLSYAGPDRMNVDGNYSINEDSAIADIEHCLMYWGKSDASGVLFDVPRVVCCLELVCNSLSLISCSALEKAARSLLKSLQVSLIDQDCPISVIPPSLLGLFDTNIEESVSRGEQGNIILSQPERSDCIVLQQFEQVDAEIAAATVSNFSDDKAQGYQHLLNAITILHDTKVVLGKLHSTAINSKAIGMRELFVHVVLSNIHFREGHTKSAIAEAKAALKVCLKLARKFVALPATSEAPCYKLPPPISGARGLELQMGKRTPLLHFKALECSSWDLLFVAKFSLCWIASLFSYSGQPHRAETYLGEAMRLVGGLNLRFFRRSPFYEYAELKINTRQLEKAKIAMYLLSSSPNKDTPMLDPHDIADTASVHHSCMLLDSAFVEQKCNEIIQRGDVLMLEGEHQEALARYLEAAQTLAAAEQSVSKMLARAKARCWRKYTRLKSQVGDFSDTTAVEDLLASMKKVKRSMKACDAHLERIKCMHVLGHVNVRLLRSSSSRAFTTLDRSIALLEEALLLGDSLGIPNLRQDLRATLGMAYFAKLEESASSDIDTMDGGYSAWYLSWASSSLLANANCVGACNVESAEDTDTSIPVKDNLTMHLQRITAGPASTCKLSPREQIKEMTKSICEKVGELPNTWLIVSLVVGLASELVITRFPANGAAPISFCLPNVAWTKCMREMDAIIANSREILSDHTAEEAGSWSTDQKREWWNTRKGLDERLQQAILCMQKSLGFWRCLLVKGASTKDSENIGRCWALLTCSKVGPIKLATRNQSLLCAIADAQTWLSKSEILDGLKHIAAEIEAPITEATAREALQVLRQSSRGQEFMSSEAMQPARVHGLSDLTMEKIAQRKVKDIKKHLASAGLSTDGLKKVLVERLIAARDTDYDSTKKWGRNELCATGQGYSTILILNHQLQEFPWEGLDVMGGCCEVTRMPSLDLIIQNARRVAVGTGSPILPSCGIRRNRVRFLLNPAGDLRSTQNQLGPILEDGADTLGWEGIIGEVPEPDKLRDYLLDADLYIYCGHGSGEAYLHRDKILSLQPNCSAALLFGCSSGRLEREGIFGPSGAVLSYLRAGSPAVLAMLWDVTDRDIDLLSVKILQDWLLADSDHNGSKSLARVLSDARNVCKLKYLNGHAAVCYGLPLHVTAD